MWCCARRRRRSAWFFPPSLPCTRSLHVSTVCSLCARTAHAPTAAALVLAQHGPYRTAAGWAGGAREQPARQALGVKDVRLGRGGCVVVPDSVRLGARRRRGGRLAARQAHEALVRLHLAEADDALAIAVGRLVEIRRVEAHRPARRGLAHLRRARRQVVPRPPPPRAATALRRWLHAIGHEGGGRGGREGRTSRARRRTPSSSRAARCTRRAEGAAATLYRLWRRWRWWLILLLLLLLVLELLVLLLQLQLLLLPLPGLLLLPAHGGRL